MIYYDNAFRLRIRHTSVYQIHQHWIFSCRNAREKLPYSFKIFPGTGDDSLLLVRTATALELPGGEKKESLFSLRAMKSSSLRQWPSFIKEQSQKAVADASLLHPKRASYQLALTKLAKAGFKPGQIVVSGPKFVHIVKGNAGRGFTLPVFTVQGTAIISNQQEAEVGIVYGVGPKRVFGCGFMHLAGQ